MDPEGVVVGPTVEDVSPRGKIGVSKVIILSRSRGRRGKNTVTRLESPSENSQWVMIQILKRENGMCLYR